MTPVEKHLEELAVKHPKFLQKGGLCVGLIVTKAAGEKGLPLSAESLRTVEGGQVSGLGKAAVQKILAEFGISKVLAEEGGRTSRGSLGLMTAYVELLNTLYTKESFDVNAALNWWITKVRAHLASEGPKFAFDSGKSIRANIGDLFRQAQEIQKNSGGTNYVGAMLQHLVGAKLDLVLPKPLHHHGFSVADNPTARAADFHVNGVAIHVTTHPTEALVRKAADNLKAGLMPLIITTTEGVSGATYILKGTEWAERIDILDAAQFLTANVYERSLFNVGTCKVTMKAIIERYNVIVSTCETDPVLLIRLD